MTGRRHVDGEGVVAAASGGWVEQATSRNASAANRLMTG
jgi:hypothetical protein